MHVLRSGLAWTVLPAARLWGETLAAGGHEGAPGGGVDPFSGDWATAIWTTILFVLLVAILGKWAWGPILNGLKKREEHIRQSIAEAEKARAEAEESLARYRQQLAEAQTQAQAIIDKGRADAVSLAEQLRQKAQGEVQEARQRAENDIVLARDEALKQIYEQTVGLATDLAGRIVKKNLNPEDHRGLLQESLNKLQNGRLEGHE